MAVKIIAEGIRRPNDFWEWTRRQELDEIRRLIVKRADEGFRKAGWPWDRAFALAAAYRSSLLKYRQFNSVQRTQITISLFWYA